VLVSWLVIFAGGAAVIAAVLWFTFTQRHPEQADRHAEDQPHVDHMGRGARSPGVVDRPAGPDAENMSADPDPRPSPQGLGSRTDEDSRRRQAGGC
jgi:hypothetical protein